MWGLIGHEVATTLLEGALARGRLAPVYLLVGPLGVGKGTLALALAKGLNCQEGPPPCGRCSQCRRIAAGLHPDVTVLALQEGEREVSIQRVRELQRALSLKPFEGRCRVAIIREVERMSHEAANALLKTLEEPPPEAVLLLTTAEEEGVLPTVRSRCQRLALHPVPRALLQQALQQSRGLAPEEAAALAAYAQGCPGRALAAVERPELLAAAAREFAALKRILEGDVEERLAQGARITGQYDGQREAAAETLRRWREWWRDLLLLKAGCQASLAHPREAGAYKEWGARLGLPEVRGALMDVGRALRQLEQNANPRLVLDVLVLHLPSVAPAGVRSRAPAST